ncbi:MAG: GEVED domain-containing protein, partial [Cytophagaceae bacterium]|nr:GEVED domain-containing protein [Cytophagaceae bacterium]
MRPRFLLTLILFITGFSAFAQRTCGTEAPTPEERAQMRTALSRFQGARIANSGTTCIPIAVHDILTNGGAGAASRTDLAKAIANLNFYFLDAGIEFYICSYTTLNSDTHYDHDKTTESSALTTAKSPVTNAMNMYLVNSITSTSGGVAGYAYYPFNSITSTVSVVDKAYLAFSPNGTVTHEFGHHFNLYHTHNGTSNGPSDALAENVARSGVQANCLTDGDELCDTQADPAGNESNCVYTDGATDIHGATYNPPIDNIMSYYSDDCGGIFTPNQISRMNSALSVRLSHSAYSLTCAAAAVNVPSGLSATFNGSNVVLSWTDNASNELGYMIERSETSSSSGFKALKNGGVANNILSFTDTDLQSNKTYYYRVKPINGACNAYSNVAQQSVGTIYCKPDYSDACLNSYLSRVVLTGVTTIDNFTNCSSGVESYVATHTASVVAGATYNLNIQISNTGFTRFGYVYADFNQDGDFDDAGENLRSAVPLNYTGNITIPVGAYNGTTRLRILASRFSTVTQACAALDFGETEDYGLL